MTRPDVLIMSVNVLDQAFISVRIPNQGHSMREIVIWMSVEVL